MSSIVDILPGVPHIESPFFEELFSRKSIGSDVLDLARTFRRDGLAVLSVPDLEIDKAAANIVDALTSQYDWESWNGQENVEMHSQDAWKSVNDVKNIACNATLMSLLSDFYGRQTFPFQTLNYPVGSESPTQSDSVHFHSCPERFMAGAMVALEDIDLENGPMFYYPGSHHLPVLTNEHIGQNPDWSSRHPFCQYPAYLRAWKALVESLGFEPVTLTMRKGQIAIWAANLLRGNSAPKVWSRTRWSQVTHYFFEDCTYYAPLGTVPFLGKILYREVANILTGKVMLNVINGQPVPRDFEGAPRPTAVPKPPLSKPRGLPRNFDGAAYLRANPDVKAARQDPAKHWLEFGYFEGRPLR